MRQFSIITVSAVLLLLATTAIAADVVRSVVILDSEIYAPAELFDLYREHLGVPVNENTATAIADTVRQKYFTDGYMRPGYSVADDGVLSGIIRIRIVEAKLSRVQFEGDAGPYQEEVQNLFEPLAMQSSLRVENIREALRQARRLAGLDVNATTNVDDSNNGALILKVNSNYQRLDGSLKLSNRGTEEIGRNLAFATLQVNGLSRAGAYAGLFLASAERSDNYHSAGAFAVAPFGSHGGTMQLRASATSINIISSDTLLEQSRDRYLIKFTRPVTTRAGNEFSLWTGLDIDNLDVLQDDVISREDRLRVLLAGWSRGWQGESSVSKLTLELKLGLSAFAARLDDFTNPDDVRDKNFAIADLHLVRLKKLAADWTLRWDAYGQYSPDELPSIKQFKVGGNRIGRGFEAAAARGNRGFGNKIELKRRIAYGKPAIEITDGYAFVDMGSAWANDGAGRESAASAGLGINVGGEHLSAYLEVAKPLVNTDADGRKDVAVFVELTARF